MYNGHHSNSPPANNCNRVHAFKAFPLLANPPNNDNTILISASFTHHQLDSAWETVVSRLVYPLSRDAYYTLLHNIIPHGWVMMNMARILLQLMVICIREVFQHCLDRTPWFHSSNNNVYKHARFTQGVSCVCTIVHLDFAQISIPLGRDKSHFGHLVFAATSAYHLSNQVWFCRSIMK